MSKTYIIGEAGVNHNGNLNIAKELVDCAVEAGVNAIKFQTFKTQNVVCKNAKKAEYQLETTGKKESQYEMLEKLELSRGMHEEIITYCHKRNIEFLSTPFDLESVELLESFHLSKYKIPSGEITNYPLLVKIAKLQKEVILSTGMSNLEEIRAAMDVLYEHGTPKISLLHCTTQYPTPMIDVNLNAMLTLKNEFGVSVGYSDHTIGIEVPIAAVAMGASIIEKHFTLDKKMSGPDHRASLEPEELKNMVKNIRNVEIALGNGEKKITSSEKANIFVVRKSIVASKEIKKGQLFTEENLTIKRPGTGINPMHWNKIIGMSASRNFQEDEQIECERRLL